MKKIIFALLLIHFSIITSNAQWIQQQSGTNRVLRGVSFANKNTGIIVGNGGKILKTTNSGLNWTLQSSIDTNDLNAVYMFNTSTYIAVGWMGTIIRTTNSGSNWIKITCPTIAELRNICFVNENIGYIVGDYVLMTTNGGYNWIILNNIPFYNSLLYDISFFNFNTGFIVGESWNYQSTIIRTSNGGENWTRLSNGLFDINLRGIYFVDSITVIAVGNNFLYRSSNCGASWSFHYLGSSAYTDVIFTNANTGFSVGTSGKIIKTTNAGINWTEQLSGTNYNLFSISFPDSMNGFAVGDNGTILRTTNGGVSGIKSLRSESPKDFYLNQNFPNPFNNETNIGYKLNSKSYIILEVLDINGKLSSVLYKGIQKAGEYKVTFKCNNLPSGIYFYRLSKRSESDTKKFIIIK